MNDDQDHIVQLIEGMGFSSKVVVGNDLLCHSGLLSSFSGKSNINSINSKNLGSCCVMLKNENRV
jgi:hypothetical protein